MPVHQPNQPPGLADKVRSTVRQFAGNEHHTLDSLRGAKADRVDVTTPHQIFTLGLDDLTSGAGLDRARAVGWRHLVEVDGKAVASAETSVAADGTHVPSHVNEGPFVNATAEAAAAAQAMPQLQTAGFEMRLLRIPALYFMALWMHSAAADLLVPLAPSPIGQEGQVVAAADALNELAERARAASAPTGPGEPDTHAP
ncbi:MAG TPA: hypothetical protein VIC57_12155 [Candidatus Dormibacteraeota bacterium]|jgi:hypothetical protein